MMAPPRISVLLPVRDGGAHLAAALASILAQDGADFELIVIDDGSTDGTAAALAACADPRLRVIRTAGLGVGGALACGQAAARGALIARMDADDIALPGRLAAQAAALDADPGAVLVHCSARLIDAAGRDRGLLRAEALPAAALRAVLLHERAGRPIIHPGVMLRAAALRAAGGYRPLPAAQDHELWLRLLDHGRFVAMPEPLLLYRRHAGAVSAARLAEQLRINLVSCICARHRQATGCDLYRDDPAAYRALDRQAELAIGPLLPGYLAARDARAALRRRSAGGALRGAWRALRSGAPGLLSDARLRRRLLALQQALLAQLPASGPQRVGTGTSPE